MTEEEWLNCRDPVQLIAFLRGKIHARKLRLVAVGSCRRMDSLLHDERSRRLVDHVERIADDNAQWEFAAPIIEAARQVVVEEFGEINWLRHHLKSLLVDDRAACVVVIFLLWKMETEAFKDTFTLFGYASSRFDRHVELLAICNIVRCVLGNPIRKIAFASEWISSTVTDVARAIYEERAFERMPILADALEDSGCDEPEIIDHCRSDGPHVRGCGVVDRILGKESTS